MTTIHHEPNAIREARDEIRRAERALDRTAPGTPAAFIGNGRLKAAWLRYQVATAHAACHHPAHARPGMGPEGALPIA
jgi:hypothetical protein